jgi:hypothetical protein
MSANLHGIELLCSARNSSKELRLPYAEHMPFFANAHNTNAANSTFNDIAGDQINIFGISDQRAHS